MRFLEVFSPAKINLTLDVLGKRPDGYHELLTLFERISLADRIRLTVTPPGPILISSQSPDIPCDARNLAYKAADLIRKHHGLESGLTIAIKKNIPVGGGLGGGSSNAATVLLACNKLFRLRLSQKKLIGYANELGSDVAFFILGKRFAVGRGRGGELTALAVPPRIRWWHLLFIAPLQVLTKDVYGKLGAGEIYPLTKKSPNVNIHVTYLKKGELARLDPILFNRLSEVVYRSYSLVSDLRTDLCKFGLTHVHMSGSGPTLFCNFAAERLARSTYAQVRRRFSDRCRIFLASTY
jgi:4-diphosphocytidyl-2-C-methyl-D-erythritol kinase